jgi:hypothetical protein
MRVLNSTLKALCLSACVSALLPQGALAQEDGWKVITVGQPGPAAEMSFADALSASKAFEKAGLPVIDIIRDMPRARLTDTLAALEGAPRLILFYSGRIPSGSISMQDGTMPLDTVLKSTAAAGTKEMILLIENCTTHSTEPAQLIVPDAPEGMDLMVISSVADGGTCVMGKRLSDRLKEMGEAEDVRGPLLDKLAGLPIEGGISTPVELSGILATGGPSVDELVELLPEDVILISLEGDFGAEEEERFNEEDFDIIEIVLPAQTPVFEVPKGGPDDPVVTFAALPAAQIAALPVATGMPEPSILVGLIEGVTDAALEEEPDDESNALDFTNTAGVRRLKVSNPDLFASLLNSGAFDPPPPALASALQGELATMNCYRMRVDGDWGNGSRRAANAYFDEVKPEEPTSPEATTDLFRLILREEVVRCPTPRVAAPAPARSTSSSRATTSRTTTNRATTSAPARTTSTAPVTRTPTTSSSRPSGNNFGSGSGVFR